MVRIAVFFSFTISKSSLGFLNTTALTEGLLAGESVIFFCALLKYNDIGKFVGSETGATYTCNAATKTIRLKHTRIMVFVAKGTFAAAVEGMDKKRGISPDFPVEQTIEDFLQGKDTVMEYTFKLIEKKTQK